jgi:hypothetical protein
MRVIELPNFGEENAKQFWCKSGMDTIPVRLCRSREVIPMPAVSACQRAARQSSDDRDARLLTKLVVSFEKRLYYLILGREQHLDSFSQYLKLSCCS